MSAATSDLIEEARAVATIADRLAQPNPLGHSLLSDILMRDLALVVVKLAEQLEALEQRLSPQVSGGGSDG